MTKKVYDVVATVGEYTTKSGEKKKRYMTVGACFQNEQGRMSIKLEAVPVGQDWSGWLSLYEPKNATDDEARRKMHGSDAHNQAKSNGYQPQRDNSATDAEGDDIPFAPKHSWIP